MLDRILARPTAPAFFFLLLFLVYALTAHYGGNVVNDVHSAAHASWSLATRGTLDLSQVALPYDQAWSVEVGDALYSNRFPGVILAGLPFYLVFQPSQPVVYPSALAAALASAAGVTAFLFALRRTVAVRWSWAAASLLGLGTGVWAVAADGLWSHGATVLWLGVAAAGLTSTGRARILTVAGGAMAVLARPHLSVALAVVALALWRRDRTAAVAVTAGGLLGAGAFLVYGRLLYGEWSVMGPYKVYDYERSVELKTTDLDGATAWRLENLALAFVAPRVGLLPAYPALLLTLWALRGKLRRLPLAPLALAMGGVAYLVVAAMLTRISGGSGAWGNRTLIETVVLAWPLLTWLVATHQGGRMWRALVSATVAWSVFFHALGALTPSPASAGEDASVMFWQVPSALSRGELWQALLAAALAVAAAAATWTLVRVSGTAALTSGPRPGAHKEAARTL